MPGKSQREQTSYLFLIILCLFLAGSQRDSKAQNKLCITGKDPLSTSVDEAKRLFQGFSSPARAPKWIGQTMQFLKMLQRL